MRKLIIFLFMIISYSSFGQTKEELHVIFAFFLKQGDSLQIYKKIDIQQDSSINIKKKRIKADSALIEVYKSDVDEYVHIIMAKNTQLENKDKEINLEKDKSKEEKKNLKKWLVGFATGDIGLIILLSLILL